MERGQTLEYLYTDEDDSVVALQDLLNGHIVLLVAIDMRSR